MKTIDGLLCTFLMIGFLITPITAVKADSGDEVLSWFPYEEVIAQPNQVEKYATQLSGVINIKGNGFALYYSDQDYINDTKENAIWFQERENYPLKRFLSDNPDFTEGKAASIFCVIEDGSGSEYGANATYLHQENFEEDTVFLGSKKERVKVDKRYDREEEKKKPIEVSFYRLRGDPYSYDGKKVKVEVVFNASEDAVVSANKETLKLRGIIACDKVNGESMDDNYDIAWTNLAKQYRQYSESGANLIWGIGIAGAKMHVNLTCMYYANYAVRENYQFKGYGGMTSQYAFMGLEIHEKDQAELIRLLKEFEESKR